MSETKTEPNTLAGLPQDLKALLVSQYLTNDADALSALSCTCTTWNRVIRDTGLSNKHLKLRLVQNLLSTNTKNSTEDIEATLPFIINLKSKDCKITDLPDESEVKKEFEEKQVHLNKLNDFRTILLFYFTEQLQSGKLTHAAVEKITELRNILTAQIPRKDAIQFQKTLKILRDSCDWDFSSDTGDPARPIYSKAYQALSTLQSEQKNKLHNNSENKQCIIL